MSGGTEAAFAPHGVGKRVSLRERCGEVRCDDKLCHALAGMHRSRRVSVVVQRNHDLPAVIGIDYADLVCRGEAVFCCKAASGDNSGHVIVTVKKA